MRPLRNLVIDEIPIVVSLVCVDALLIRHFRGAVFGKIFQRVQGAANLGGGQTRNLRCGKGICTKDGKEKRIGQYSAISSVESIVRRIQAANLKMKM